MAERWRIPSEPTDEALVVRVAGGDIAAFTLRPGDSVTIPRGWTGEWDIRSPLRKVYAIWKVW